MGVIRFLKRLSAFLLELMLFGFNFLIAALRELALLLEPPFRAELGLRWRLAIDETERVIIGGVGGTQGVVLEWFCFWFLKLAQIGVGSSGLWVAVCRHEWVVLLDVGGWFARRGWVVCSPRFCGSCVFCSTGFLWVLAVICSMGFNFGF